MKKTLLGIKIIGGLAVIGPIINISHKLITHATKINFFETYIGGLISIIVGINLLRRREGARKFTIFLCYLGIVVYAVFMILTPIFILKADREYQETLKLYREKKNYIEELRSNNATKEETLKASRGLSNLEDKIERHKVFEKDIEGAKEEFSFKGIGTFITFGWYIFIIYYLKKDYVRRHFHILVGANEFSGNVQNHLK